MSFALSVVVKSLIRWWFCSDRSDAPKHSDFGQRSSAGNAAIPNQLSGCETSYLSTFEIDGEHRCCEIAISPTARKVASSETDSHSHDSAPPRPPSSSL